MSQSIGSDGSQAAQEEWRCKALPLHVFFQVCRQVDAVADGKECRSESVSKWIERVKLPSAVEANESGKWVSTRVSS